MKGLLLRFLRHIQPRGATSDSEFKISNKPVSLTSGMEAFLRIQYDVAIALTREAAKRPTPTFGPVCGSRDCAKIFYLLDGALSFLTRKIRSLIWTRSDVLNVIHCLSRQLKRYVGEVLYPPSLPGIFSFLETRIKSTRTHRRSYSQASRLSNKVFRIFFIK